MIFIPPFIPQLLPVSSQLRGIKRPYRIARLTQTQCSILNSHSPTRYCQARNIRRTGDGFSVFPRYSLLSLSRLSFSRAMRMPVNDSKTVAFSLPYAIEGRKSIESPLLSLEETLYKTTSFFLFEKKVHFTDYRIPSHLLSRGFMC